MVNGISNSSQIYSPYTLSAAQAVQPQSVGMEVAVSMLQKTMDTQSIALTQLLQSMGIGNNIDAQA
ncbi:MAG: hypothetical protein NT018_02505 [Armatimonadetes bacterium]|nr:hypothetical protein [Armatimonadota bacterium]